MLRKNLFSRAPTAPRDGPFQVPRFSYPRPSRSTPFTATEITALAPAAWYRFNTGITDVGAGAVSQWADQSGNARHLLQATGTAQPTVQGNGTIIFDGSTDFLQTAGFTLNQPVTIYILGRQITWTLNDLWFDGLTAAVQLRQSPTTPNVQLNSNVGAVAAHPGLTVNTYRVLAAVFSGANSTLRVNNDETAGSPGTNNLGGFTLGASRAAAAFANIQVYEVIIFSSAHDKFTQGRVLAYLAALGGLTL